MKKIYLLASLLIILGIFIFPKITSAQFGSGASSCGNVCKPTGSYCGTNQCTSPSVCCQDSLGNQYCQASSTCAATPSCSAEGGGCDSFLGQSCCNGYTCNTTYSVCYTPNAGKSVGSGCFSNSECASGDCAGITAGAGGTVLAGECQCTSNSQCADTNSCTTDTCSSGSCIHTPTSGGACTVNGQSGTCSNGSCVVSAPCQSARGDNCSSVPCCSPLACNDANKLCILTNSVGPGQPCFGDLECQNGYTCQSGTCQPPVTYPDGHSCTSGLSCQSGACCPAPVSVCYTPATKPSGSSCYCGFECASGACVSGQCSGSFTLTVQKSGSGKGTVSGNGINCGSTCSQTFTNSTPVTLVATPDASSTFGSWSGVNCSGGNTNSSCVFTVNGPVTVTATFNLGSSTCLAEGTACTTGSDCCSQQCSTQSGACYSSNNPQGANAPCYDGAECQSGSCMGPVPGVPGYCTSGTSTTSGGNGSSTGWGGITKITIQNPLSAQSIPDFINIVINLIFWLVIAIVPLMVLIAAFLFVTAAGDAQKVATARNILLYTAIGFAIILLAKAITYFLLDVL